MRIIINCIYKMILFIYNHPTLKTVFRKLIMNFIKKPLMFAVTTTALASLSACQTTSSTMLPSSSASILEAYANMAADVYGDAHSDAKKLQQAIKTFNSAPSASGLNTVKTAWLASRESYGETEIFRLSNGPIDAEEGWVADAYGALEGQLNAWPLDENMIDYTIDENGNRTSGNIIDTSGLFNPGGENATAVNVSTINADAIAALNENGGDANVATGYHAIEFLVWGQDQDYANFSADNITKGALTAGQRPISDYTDDQFSARRMAYLAAAAEQIVADLGVVSSAWSTTTSADCSVDATGCYRAALLNELKGKDADKNIPKTTALKQIIGGMGVFIKSELANERIAVAVLTPSEEDEHSCFSDNTHRDITLNYQGFLNVLKANYNGKSYGDSFYAKANGATKEQVDTLISSINAKVAQMNSLAETKWHFDYQILAGNNARQIRKMKNEMRKLGDMMVSVADDMNISLTEEDVTDAEETKL